MTNEDTPMNELTPRTETSRRPTPVTPQVLQFDEEGPIPTPEEQRMMLIKWRKDLQAKGKQKEKDDERSRRETERLSKQREADRLRLQALKLQREEIEIQEKALREALDAEGPDTEDRSTKRTRDDEDESWNSESYSRRSMAKQPLPISLYQSSMAKQPLSISFTEDDYEDVIWPHEDPLVINPVIGENKIWKVLVDEGISVNILYHHTYSKMNLGGEQLEPCHEAPLYGFGNQPVPIEGTITLSVLLGKAPYTVSKEAKFYVVRVDSPYNGILGRPALSLFQAVSSIPHLKLKFPTEHGVGEMRGDQKAARIIMLEDLEKDRDMEMAEAGKRKRTENDVGGSHQLLNIESEKSGADLSSPIAKPTAENTWHAARLRRFYQ